MNIIAIEDINKQKSRIILDSGERFVLYRGEIRLLKLKVDSPLENDLYEGIMGRILPKRCKLRSMNLLKSKDYTEFQLRTKLSDGEYPPLVIDEAIEYVKSYGYINDYRYATDYFNQKISQKSVKEIKAKLLTKGIPKDICEAVIDNSGFDISDREAERELIRKTLVKRGYRSDLDYEDKQKLLSYFYRRGFDIDMVRHAMDRLDEDCGD